MAWRGLRRYLRVAWLAGFATLAVTAAAAAGVRDWSGFYAGMNAGLAFGAFQTNTAVDAGSYFGTTGRPYNFTSADIGAIGTAGALNIYRNGFSGGLQFGRSWQFGALVAGIEADADFLHMNGAQYGAAAYSTVGLVGGESFKNYYMESSHSEANWIVTFRPRLGYATGDKLFYLTGGLALTAPHVDYTFVDAWGATETARSGSGQAGYAVGVGTEWSLSNRLSLKAEFLHIGFGTAKAAETASNLGAPSFNPPQAFWHHAGFHPNLVRFGLNYRFGEADEALDDANTTKDSLPDWLFSWQIETGLRVMAVNGNIGAANPLMQQVGGASFAWSVSRLQFSGLRGVSGEAFLRVDHDSGFFFKSFVGAGGIVGGELHDEDFPSANAYSNSVSPGSGSFGYADADLGYSVLRAPGADFGVFAGFDTYRDYYLTYGCTQIAASKGVCHRFKPAMLSIPQDASFNAVRLGVSSRFMATNRLRFDVEAAYLPWVTFDGQDDHIQSMILYPQSASGGDGAMLEGRLDYDVTDAWSIGLGGRVWMWNMHNGSESFIVVWATGLAAPLLQTPARYNGEHYGLFLETSYRFGDHREEKATDTEAVDWTGVYVGGTLGAGWSDARWDDTYASMSPWGTTNVPGFNDTTHAPGGMGGGRLTAQWQDGSWVVGLQADGSWMNAQRRNTCYSGLGGADCTQRIHSVYNIALRGGYAFNRTLAYLRLGEAWVVSQYILDCNSYGLFQNNNFAWLGRGSADALVRGWLAGAGLEYELDRHWSTGVEYNHVGGLRATLVFPDVAVIGTTPHRVQQTLDTILVGVSYRLD